MSGPDSIDELFLKAAELSGSKRRKFLRTLPADIRAQVEKLLAAEESLDGRGFLSKPIHQSQTKKGLQKQKAKSTTSPSGGSRRKTTTQPSVGSQLPNPKRRTKGTKQSGGGAKRSKTATSSAAARWLAAVAGIAVSVGLVLMIVSTLRGRFRQSDDLPETAVQVAVTEEAVPADLPPETTIEPEMVLPDPAAEPPSQQQQQFYSSAINAPPLTERELKALPGSLHDASPVANPLPLPGVRAWSLETIGYRVWSGAVGLSPDGRYAAVESVDGSLRVVDIQTGAFRNMIVTCGKVGQEYRHVGYTGSVTWASDSKALLILANGILYRIDSMTGAVINSLAGVRGDFCLSADGKAIYVFRDQNLLILTEADFSVQEELPIDGIYRRVDLSPTDSCILLSSDHSIGVFRNVRPLELLLADTQLSRSGPSVISDDGTAVTAWNDGKIRVYQTDGAADAVPKAGFTQEFLAYPDGYTASACWSWVNDDRVLCTGTAESVDQYSVSKNQFVVRERNPRWGAPAQYSRNRRIGIVAGAALRTVVNGRPDKSLLEGDVSLMENLTFSADGTELLTGGYSKARYNLTTGVRSPVIVSKTGIPSYEYLAISDSRELLLGLDAGRLFVYLSTPAMGDRVRVFDFANIRHAVWADGDRCVLVRTNAGEAYYLQLDTENAQPTLIQVAGGEKVVDIAWNRSGAVALLLMESKLVKWDPETDVVTDICEVPEHSRAITLNSTGTYLAIAAPKTQLMDTAGYSTMAEFEWKNAKPFWVTNDELIGISDGGRTMYKVNPTTPDDVTQVPIPLAGLGNRRAFAVSPTAPVAAAITGGNQIRFIDLRNGAHMGTLLPFRDDHVLLTPEGKIVGMSEGMQNQLIYQILTDSGQETLNSSEFQRRFGEYLPQ